VVVVMLRCAWRGEALSCTEGRWRCISSGAGLVANIDEDDPVYINVEGIPL
jgi:hypothetical protein